ncbi:major facilitator superfamily domain-containing protein [Hypoxylon sp. FL1857]|nr:major facilitator superfamily domain-containing protein [Hypoxylon sp. FL1857]
MILMVSFTAMISPLSGAMYLPALPSLSRDLNVSTSLINLTVTTYLIGLAPSFIGNFADFYGRRPAYMICCVIYLAANIGLAVQKSYAALIIPRCLQNCGSSATIALGSAASADLATRVDRGKYLGYAAMEVTLVPALGPVNGGLLDQYLDRYSDGFLLDWNFRRHAKITSIFMSHNRQQGMAALPIEKIRLEIALPFVYLASALVVAYSWIFESKLSLAAIEVLLFFCGVVIVGAVNGLNTLVVDTHVRSPATVVAVNNLYRCLIGAGAAAIGASLIERIGMGWTGFFVA